MATLAHPPPTAAPAAPRQPEPLQAAFWWLAAFLAVYCARPEDWIPGVGHIHPEKVIGGLALLALILGMARARPEVLKLSPSMKLLVVLFLDMLVGAFFSPVWRGGAVSMVAKKFSEVVIVAIAITWVATRLRRVRTLLFLQAGTVALIALVSLEKSRSDMGRLAGALGGNYSNPNDLALALVLAIPLCLGFLLLSRRKLRKLAWAGAIVVMIYVITLTYSRGGFLSLMVAIGVSVWELGVRGKRKWLVWGTALMLASLLAAAGPSGYGARLATILHPSTDKTGSAQQREQLFWRSLTVTEHHPIFGVGADNFAVVSGVWHVAHDSYTEMAADCGVPALILFVLILRAAFADIRKVRQHSRNPETLVLAGALRASMWAFVVGGCFSSVTYLFFPYLLMAYACALKRTDPDAWNADGTTTPRQRSAAEMAIS
ncbi:MAG: O-antigen ligase family protein [Terriglobales bacterium]